MYKYRLRKDDSFEARFTASIAVLVTVFFHFFFIASCIRFFGDYKKKIFQFHDDKIINKLILAIVALILIVLNFLYFNKKRTNKIVEKYENTVNDIFSFKNILLFLIIVLIPLTVGIYLLNHSEFVIEMNER